ncbi:hypothetical protein HYFRA_00001678 [Hymenoscyphus fraxineus]|uniref:Transcription initiation factor TFIID subunit 8 n=1 Tax=Hymenoscyphus fraxineus TaxID=746836 RepID=A0A9N9L4B2_9HELO|nr:hypothetical protein HYFRA_00001678 [Hymenoscyphus fraxineus]
MGPVSPVSRKRSTPSHSDDDLAEVQTSKKICVKPTLPHTPPPETPLEAPKERAQDFEDEPRALLRRQIAMTLHHVGFDGSEPEAMESFCMAVETYFEKFASRITLSMHNSRRSLPIPSDFQHGLSAVALPLLSLEPHLDPPVAPIKRLPAEPPEESKIISTVALLGEELDGNLEKKMLRQIPKNFPSFPSKHTYKRTEQESQRETDPRKIREEAANAARHAEEALRRLVNVEKAVKEKNVKKNASKDPRSKERHDIWEETMRSFMKGQERRFEVGEHNGNDDRSMIVNSERQFFRKGAISKRKPPKENGESA